MISKKTVFTVRRMLAALMTAALLAGLPGMAAGAQTLTGESTAEPLNLASGIIPTAAWLDGSAMTAEETDTGSAVRPNSTDMARQDRTVRLRNQVTHSLT